MELIDSDALEHLHNLRDHPPLTSRLTMAGALIHETYQLFQTFPQARSSRDA